MWNAHTYTYGDTNADSDAYGDAHTDANAHSHSDGYGDANADADSYGHSDFDADTDAYSHAQTYADAQAAADASSAGVTLSGPLIGGNSRDSAREFPASGGSVIRVSREFADAALLLHPCRWSGVSLLSICRAESYIR